MFNELSARERQIVLMAAEGLTDKEIAAELKVQVATVRTYWERLRNKLIASNKSEAIAKALRHIIAEQDKWQKLIVESAAEYAMFALDEEGIVLSWNAGVKSVLGYDEEEFIGLCADLIFTPEDREKGAHLQERETARREGKAADERFHLRKDGRRFFGSGMMIRLMDAGKPAGFAKILRDMSEIYELRMRVKELEARV